MNVRFTNKPSDDVVLSSAIPDIVISTELVSVRFLMSVNGEIFYDVNLYATDFQVTVRSLADIIEAHFRARDYVIAEVQVAAGIQDDPDSCDFFSFRCLYCSCIFPDGFNPSETFLSASTAQRVPPTAVMPLRCDVNVDDESCKIFLSGIDGNGEPISGQTSVYAYNSIFTINIPDMAEFCKSALGIETLSMMNVVYGNRSKIFYIDRTPGFMEFRFKNIFNCMDAVFIHGMTTLKPESGRELAVCGGKPTLYDITSDWTYETSAESLTRDEAVQIALLQLSYGVSVVMGGVEYPIAITDFSSKISDDDSAISSVKMTWRFLSSRPHLANISSGFGIFTNQFTDPFQ